MEPEPVLRQSFGDGRGTGSSVDDFPVHCNIHIAVFSDEEISLALLLGHQDELLELARHPDQECVHQ